MGTLVIITFYPTYTHKCPKLKMISTAQIIQVTFTLPLLMYYFFVSTRLRTIFSYERGMYLVLG